MTFTSPRRNRLSAPPALRAASAWLDARSRRERVLILGLGLLAVVAVLWYGLALPLMRAREAATLRIETAAELSSRLRTTPAAVGAPGVAPLEGALADVVARRAEAAGLALTRVEPDAAGEGASIGIDNARYDAVMPFVAALEGADGAQVRNLSVERTGQPGMVRMQMRIVRP